ncbi:MAG: 50S ribosomal protein L31 [Candidatus Dojkabacteria bacterium]|nr:50S ribosomal protein L31 [Candidatus Dojkabacteria bacterium]
MKANIHPKTYTINITCSSCGATYTVESTIQHDYTVGTCANCHPIYRGEKIDQGTQKDARVSAFTEKIAKAKELQEKIKQIRESKQQRLANRVGVIAREKPSLSDIVAKKSKK